MTVAGNPVRHMHHHACACWDSEETRHLCEDIPGMPRIAAVVLEILSATSVQDIATRFLR